jgi:hypothetical protein
MEKNKYGFGWPNMHSPLKKPKYRAYYGRTTSPIFFLKKNDVFVYNDKWDTIY